jgi:hypothetical protein
MSRLRLALLLLVGCAACGPKIAALTERPRLFYDAQVSIVGRVSRLHAFTDEVLLELADAQERLILARVPAADAPRIGDWIEVRGVFVPDLRVGDRVVYDVIAAERVKSHRAPWLPNLF